MQTITCDIVLVNEDGTLADVDLGAGKGLVSSGEIHIQPMPKNPTSQYYWWGAIEDAAKEILAQSVAMRLILPDGTTTMLTPLGQFSTDED